MAVRIVVISELCLRSVNLFSSKGADEPKGNPSLRSFLSPILGSPSTGVL
jgi:hypothetical protein